MSASTTTALLLERVALDPASRLISLPDTFGGWFDLTAAEFLDRVRALAKGFLTEGLRVGDRVGVLCSNRFEATLVDFAAAMVGIATVPLDADIAQESLLAVLDDARAVGVVVETARDFARFDELHSDLPSVQQVWQIALADLDKLALRGRGGVSDAELGARIVEIGAETPLADHYLGQDGGVLRRTTLTHGVAASRAVALAGVLARPAGDRDRPEIAEPAALLVLPATDVASRITALVAVTLGARMGHLADPARLVATLASFRPTLLVARPPLLEALDHAAQERAQSAGRAPAVRQALEVADEYAGALDGPVSRGLRTRFAVADALVLRGLRRTAGGRLVDIVSIADETSLAPRLRLLMRALEARPLEAYGSAETAGIAIVERPGDPFGRPEGTIGRPLDGVEASISPAGTLVLAGLGVARAVPVESSAASRVSGASAGDGSVDTGLPASLDEGRVRIRGRAPNPTSGSEAQAD
ncbi:Long-chain-fatty-acid--CoA ligase FadD15 [Frondihabitans sp. 762G35]|uniref:AMP-binding protein n=1 Tax=Frondihabitans sp. 762G35 TaxID=1446794 RepID=UPI000D212892|nr:AMP-binding protein [Frondihabitans sp. 762G35]ARC56741.1 Long-chain-fatty-acid--CoA ligase FadD15 [Frondihabitans sp. 762G35]